MENLRKTKLVVYREHTLGYIQPQMPNQVNIIRGNVLKGGDKHFGYYPFLKDGDYRLATEKDFQDFKVVFKGYKNDSSYIYKK